MHIQRPQSQASAPQCPLFAMRPQSQAQKGAHYMRPLSSTLQAAIGSGMPECKVELIDWAPHYSAIL